MHSTQNVSRLIIKLDCKAVEPNAYMQKLTHFTISKNCHDKIPVGATWGHRPHNVLAVGGWGDRPHHPHGVGAYASA